MLNFFHLTTIWRILNFFYLKIIRRMLNFFHLTTIWRTLNFFHLTIIWRMLNFFHFDPCLTKCQDQHDTEWYITIMHSGMLHSPQYTFTRLFVIYFIMISHILKLFYWNISLSHCVITGYCAAVLYSFWLLCSIILYVNIENGCVVLWSHRTILLVIYYTIL